MPELRPGLTLSSVQANPEIAPEAPIEQAAPTRRRVIESDSEDDEEPAHAPSRSVLPAPSVARPILPTPVPDDEDLMHEEESPASGSTPHLPSSKDSNNGRLIDVSDDEAVIPAAVPSQRALETLLPVAQVEDKNAALAERCDNVWSGHQTGYDDADLLEQITDRSSRLGSHVDKEVLTNRKAEEQSDPQGLPLSLANNTVTSPEVPSPPPITRPAFDPSNYGSSPQVSQDPRGRGGQRGKGNNGRGGNRGGRGQNGNRASNLYTPRPEQAPTGASTRAGHRRGRGDVGPSITAPNGRSLRSHGPRGNAAQFNHRNLVDVQAPTSTVRPSTVPPGFESTVPLMPANATYPPIVLPDFESEPPVSTNSARAPAVQPGLDATTSSAPINAFPGVSLQSRNPGRSSLSTNAPSRPQIRSNATSGSSTSGRATRYKFSDNGSKYITTHVPKRDQAAMREKSLTDALAAITGSNKKAEEEEEPKVHSTMRQQAKNPGKNSGGGKKESDAEARARRQRVLDEAYGTSSAAKSTNISCGFSKARGDEQMEAQSDQEAYAHGRCPP